MNKFAKTVGVVALSVGLVVGGSIVATPAPEPTPEPPIFSEWVAETVPDCTLADVVWEREAFTHEFDIVTEKWVTVSAETETQLRPLTVDQIAALDCPVDVPPVVTPPTPVVEVPATPTVPVVEAPVTPVVELVVAVTPELAYTGGNDFAPLWLIAIVVVLIGTAAIVFGRRNK